MVFSIWCVWYLFDNLSYKKLIYNKIESMHGCMLCIGYAQSITFQTKSDGTSEESNFKKSIIVGLSDYQSFTS